jgi:hypothetical protein
VEKATMAELDQNQTDTGTEITPSPLDTILDTNAADVPARDREEGLGGGDAPHVPLVALKRERERRQKADRQVEELRAELDRFDNAKWGFDEPAAEQQPAGDDSVKDPFVQNYDRSLGRFTLVHGKDVVAKVDAGLNRLNVEQRQHVMNLTGRHPDPVAAIHAYVEQLGLLDFKGTPIEDVLASKDKQQQPQFDTSQLVRHIEQLNQYGQAIATAEKRANFAASKADFVAEHGKGAYNEIDRLSIELVQSGHPVGQQFYQAVLSSSDPVTTAAQFLAELGVWQQQNPRQQAPQQQMTFPSNLANRRNVGQRHGPSFSGPTPLNDIFKH